MKLAYTDENRLLVEHVKNLFEQAGIEVWLKNEFIAGGAGELAPLDTWLELWVSDNEVNVAKALLNEALAKTAQADWVCHKCGERNGANFELCWQCQNPKFY